MSDFTFISHDRYPEDGYIEESVVLCIAQKHRVTYIRKKMKNGGKFWDVISAAVKKDGANIYLKSYMQDSNFLRDDIMKFLETRAWEKSSQVSGFIAPAPTSGELNLQPIPSFEMQEPLEFPF